MKAIGQLQIHHKRPQSRQDIFFNNKLVILQKLKILVLSGNDIINDQLGFINKCTQLHKLDLSNNCISIFNNKIGFDKLTKLNILYLHDNKIQNAAGLQGVFMIPNLIHLTINSNPVQKLPRIQHLIINVLPTLKVLGKRVIFVQERTPDFITPRNNIYIEPQIIQGWKQTNNTQTLFLKIMQFQLKYFDNLWLYANPIVFIQRTWRQLIKTKKISIKQIKSNNKDAIRKKYAQFGVQLNFIKEYFDEWKKYSKIRKTIKKQLSTTSTYPIDKSYLTYPLLSYKNVLRNHKIQSIIKAYITKIKETKFIRKMAQRLYKQLKKKQIQFNSSYSFYQLCQINNTHRFYFSKTQTHLLQNLLLHLEDNFGWKNLIQKSCKIGTVHEYLSIRFVDPQAFSNKKVYSVLTYSIWPSMKAVFLKKKHYQSTKKTVLINIRPLYYIQNKNKRVSQQQYKKSLIVYKSLQKFYQKQYQNNLQYFQCPNQQIMKMLLRYIYYYNTKTLNFSQKLKKPPMNSIMENYQQPLIIYVQKILQRTTAAVRIQQNWRKYLIIKHSQQSLYVKMKKTRCVMRIQRFWKDLPFYHRLAFQKNMAHELKLYTSQSFLIPTEIYLKISDICRIGKKNALYKGMSLFKQPISKRLSIAWMRKKCVYSPIISKQNFPSYSKQLPLNKLGEKCDIWNLLHFNSKTTKVLVSGREFYEFQFPSVQQTKYRVYLLALLTYTCKRSACLLPLPKQSFNLLQLRLESYASMKLMIPIKQIQTKSSLKQKQHKQSPQISKLSLIKQFKQNGIFITCNNQQYPQKSIHSIIIQFYQKTHDTFPFKYNSTLYYSIANATQEQSLISSDNHKQPLAKGQLDKPQQTLIPQKPKQQAQLFNITKLNKKRFSLYEFQKKFSQTHQDVIASNTQFFSQLQHEDKRHSVLKKNKQKFHKKCQLILSKTQNLRKLRQDINRQKIITQTTKNINMIQRTQKLKQNVQKIKQIRKRASLSKQQQNSEDQFIQQGNFVMEQQLKMMVMRDKINAKNNRKQRQKTLSVSSKRNSQCNSKTQRLKELSPKPINFGATQSIIPVNYDEKVEGRESKKTMAHTVQARKTKTRSIGAYLRDPSLVHGVFPEQYYPIQTKFGGAVQLFPRLG